MFPFGSRMGPGGSPLREGGRASVRAADDYTSVVYWYQEEDPRPWVPLPEKRARRRLRAVGRGPRRTKKAAECLFGCLSFICGTRTRPPHPVAIGQRRNSRHGGSPIARDISHPKEWQQRYAAGERSKAGGGERTRVRLCIIIIERLCLLFAAWDEMPFRSKFLIRITFPPKYPSW